MWGWVERVVGVWSKWYSKVIREKQETRTALNDPEFGECGPHIRVTRARQLLVGFAVAGRQKGLACEA